MLVGRATRLARFVSDLPKTYLGTARLGARTETDDPTGESLPPLAGATRTVPVEEIRAALAGFVGPQRQRPPAYSAKLVGGVRSYRRARRGEDVALAETDVTVHAIELVEYRAPDVIFRATVSAGTYVRALARDLGERLGTGAHLAALRREAVGPWRVEQATPLARLDQAAPLMPARDLVAHLPSVALDEAGAQAVRHGRALPAGSLVPTGGPVALLREGTLVAVGVVEGAWLKPSVVLMIP